MVFTAKWQLVSVENAEAFYKQIKTPQAFIDKLKVLHAELKTNPNTYVEDITIDKAGGTAHRVVHIRGEKQIDSGPVKLNEEFDHETADGRHTKAKVTLEGDTTLIFHEKGADFEASAKLVLHGDELIVTLKSGDVVSTEKYKKA